MERLKEFLASYLTSLLSILLVLNVIIVFFSMMGITWQQFIQLSSNLGTILSDSSHSLYHDTQKTSTTTTTDDTTRAIKRVSGIVNDPNIQLVCSDETFAIATSKVRPAVVSITCDLIQPADPPYDDTAFDDPTPNLRILGGIGSGVIVDARGYILTCYHMIEKASNIYIIPFGYKENKFKASVIAIDKKVNLAILKIQCPYKLPEAALGDSEQMEIADIVLAIGNPFGLEQSVTHGIISDNRRDLLIKGIVYRDMFQTDAPINRGSSGGPLVNMSGEVIGINMAIYSSTGVYSGVSFALPVNQAKVLIARNIPSGEF
ncbi:MAG: trypsin-like peptidase domain-containing protein [Candidatus Magnetomorum sp.]|nr:trypsin-like peptidase domain-containing protein [Candidatus Magnetomorum sp.]